MFLKNCKLDARTSIVEVALAVEPHFHCSRHGKTTAHNFSMSMSLAKPEFPSSFSHLFTFLHLLSFYFTSIYFVVFLFLFGHRDFKWSLVNFLMHNFPHMRMQRICLMGILVFRNMCDIDKKSQYFLGCSNNDNQMIFCWVCFIFILAGLVLLWTADSQSFA